MTLNLQDCTAIESLLDAYHDGELVGDEKASVEMHLRACDACPKKLAQIERLVSVLKAVPPASSKIDFADRFEVPAASTVPLAPTGSNHILPGKFGRVAAIAAAVALCVGFGQYVLRHNMSTSEVASLSPQSGIRSGMSGNQVSKTLQMEQLAASKLDDAPANDSNAAGEAPASQSFPGMHGQSDSRAQAKRETRVKPPVVRVAKNFKSPAAVNTTLASASPSSDESDKAVSVDRVKHSLVAFYASDPNTIPEELGISTDEDGLYAIKM
jgi:anti-sigma factor RsiW